MLTVWVLLVGLMAISVNGTQLFYPMETQDGWCGPYRECPKGTQCMRLFDRNEPFSCFLPHFGSTFSFIEESRSATVTPIRRSPPPVILTIMAAVGAVSTLAFVLILCRFAFRKAVAYFYPEKQHKPTVYAGDNPSFQQYSLAPGMCDV